MGKKIKQEPRVKLEHVESQQQTVKKQQEQPLLKLENTHDQPQHIRDAKPRQERQDKQEKHDRQDKQGRQDRKNQDNQQAKEKKKKIKHARLIIRNLVFDINEKHVRKLIAPFGQIKEINIPMHPDKKITKGFAFVEMSNRNECLRAIKALNGSTFKGRTIVLDEAVSKQNFMTEKLNEEDEAGKENKIEEENQQDGEKMEDEGEVKQQVGEQNGQEGQEDQQQAENSDEQQQNEAAEDQKVKKQSQDHLLQIFIRNIPISTTEDQLHKIFSRQGKIAFVKICKNRETNLSKGTAFIKFYDPEVAQKLIEYSRSYEMYLLKKIKNFVPDPTINLEIDGAIIKIFPVESRESITDKLKDRETPKDKKTTKPVKKIKKLEDLVKTDIHGKRKLALALYGRWKAEEGMSTNDYDMLKAHEKEKIEKLKNPNESISSTRVILKHLDKTITEDQIRNFCLNFLAEKNMGKFHLTYCKLMLERDMKKSAGFAFVEFKHHETAKQFIQMLVDNHKKLQKQLFIVEFAIQDSRKMLKLSKKNKNVKVEGTKKEKKQQIKTKKIKKPRWKSTGQNKSQNKSQNKGQNKKKRQG